MRDRVELVTGEVFEMTRLQLRRGYPALARVVCFVHVKDEKGHDSQWAAMCLDMAHREATLGDPVRSATVGMLCRQAAELLVKYFLPAKDELNDFATWTWKQLACAKQANWHSSGVFSLVFAWHFAAARALPKEADGLLWSYVFHDLLKSSWAPESDDGDNDDVHDHDHPGETVQWCSDAIGPVTDPLPILTDELSDPPVILGDNREQIEQPQEVDWPNQFLSDFPYGAMKVPTESQGRLCAWYALRHSIRHQIPGIRAPEVDELQFIYNTLAIENPEFEMENSDTFRVDQLIVTAQKNLAQFNTCKRLGVVYPQSGQGNIARIYAQSDHLSDEHVLWLYNDNHCEESWRNAHYSGLRHPTAGEQGTQKMQLLNDPDDSDRSSGRRDFYHARRAKLESHKGAVAEVLWLACHDRATVSSLTALRIAAEVEMTSRSEFFQRAKAIQANSKPFLAASISTRRCCRVRTSWSRTLASSTIIGARRSWTPMCWTGNWHVWYSISWLGFWRNLTARQGEQEVGGAGL